MEWCGNFFFFKDLKIFMLSACVCVIQIQKDEVGLREMVLTETKPHSGQSLTDACWLQHVWPCSPHLSTWSSHLLPDSSAILRASISASSIFCSMSCRSSWPRIAVTLMRCISVSASAAFWASSLASSSAIWAFSASRSAVCSKRSWRGAGMMKRWERN